MKLQGRNLSLQSPPLPPMQGDDVKLLQTELQQLGFPIPTGELISATFGNGTNQAVLNFQTKFSITSATPGTVDPVTADAINARVDALQGKLVVRGQVRRSDGNPLRVVTVKAVDKDMRSEEPLGEATTDSTNHYEIAYTADQFRRAEKQTADLIVRAFDRDGLLLAASDILFNAPPVATIGLIIGPRPDDEPLSEYEQILKDLTPLLEGVALADLVDQDLAFLFGETAIDRQRTEFLRQGAKLSRETNIPTEAFYGWAREGIPLILLFILALTNDKLLGAIQQAISANIIPARLLDSLDEIISRLDQLRARKAFEDERSQIPHEVLGQLLDEKTGEPLSAGFFVHGFDLDAGVPPKDLGQDRTGARGFFTLVYRTPQTSSSTTTPPTPATGRRLLLKILDSERREIFSTEAQSQEQKVLLVTVPVPAPTKPSSPRLDELQSLAGINLPAALLSFLSDHNIHTLDEVRSNGGIGRLSGLPVAPDAEVVRKLDAQANLSVLSPDVQSNARVIDGGFFSISGIANTPRSDFVAKLHGTLGDFKAGQLHAMARAEKMFLDNVLTAQQTNNANGFELGGDSGGDGGPHQCGCKDCEAAVSPIAYLADLIDYTLKNVQNDGDPISLLFLADHFYQPFDELLASCDESEKQVRRVRLCIEVLRRFLAANKLTLPPDAEKRYLSDAYHMLLTRFGVSVDEIRLAQTADDAARKNLAERLGIDVDDALADELDTLRMGDDPTEQSIQRVFGLANTDLESNPLSDGLTLGTGKDEIIRWNLEGVAWRVNTGVEGPIHVTLKKSNGKFRIELYRDSQRKFLIASGERATPVGPITVVEENASGLFGRVEINYIADSADIRFAALPRFLSWRLRHLRSIWRDQDRPTNLYADLPSDLTEDETADLPPIIDPDVIGPDDFRVPFANEVEPVGPFDIWLKRRAWVNDRLHAMSDLKRDVGKILDSLNKPTEYLSVPKALSPWAKKATLDDLIAISSDLSKAESAAAARQRIARDLHLTPESFSRLMLLLGKNDSGEKMTDDEWDEIYSILVQAQKVAFFSGWRAEEEALDVKLGPEHFWISLASPKEGNLRFAIGAGPLVDPDLVKEDALPEPAVGRRILAIWRNRRLEIEDITKSLTTERKNNGFDAMLKLALGDPLPYDLAQLDDNLQKNVDVDETTKKITGDLHMTVEDFTHLMALKRKNDVVGPNKQPLAEAEWSAVYAILTSAEKKSVAYPRWLNEEAGIPDWALLKAKLPQWRASKDSRQAWQRALRGRSQAPLIDPHVIGFGDLRNPSPNHSAYELWAGRGEGEGKWSQTRRAEFENERQAGATELARIDGVLIKALFDETSGPIRQGFPSPTVAGIQAQLKFDASRGGLDYILKQVLGNPLPDLDALFADLTNLNDPPQVARARIAIATTLYLTPNDFQQLITIRRGVGQLDDACRVLARAALVKSVMGLDDENKKGNDITTRLDQLALPMDAFSFLVRMRKLAASEIDLEPGEWTNVENILVEVRKRRSFARWRDEEKESDITLGPDFFKFPPVDPTVFPPPPPAPLIGWLATRGDRRDWQDTLQTRIDQQNSTIAAFEQAVSATEQAVLPGLRDDLVLATKTTPFDLEGNAKWVTEHLFIDAKAGGCQMTTRVAQAIETIQDLIFAIRTGELKDPTPHLTLGPPQPGIPDNFDEEWQWMGSYATWRAAMFVFLYPENILIPSLRQRQTPAFRKLISDVRDNPNLTPRQACEAAKAYSDYLRDVCNLTVEATCQVKTLVHRSHGCDKSSLEYKNLFYMFGRSRETTSVYWSAYDPKEAIRDAQTFWERVPALKDTKVSKILGATPYQWFDRRFIVLFAHSEDKGKQKLVFTRYDLETQIWDQELKEVNPPTEGDQETNNFDVVMKQQERDNVQPQVFLRLPSGAIYSAYLNNQVTDLEKDGWKLILGHSLGSRFSDLLAAVEVASAKYYLIVRQESNGDFLYRSFILENDALWLWCGGGDFRGAFSSQAAPDVLVVGSDAVRLRGATLSHITVTYADELDRWLRDRLAIYLDLLAVPNGMKFDKTSIDDRTYEGWSLFRLMTNHDEKFDSDFAFWKQTVVDELENLWATQNTPDWNEWKLADEMVTEFTVDRGVNLATVMKRVIDNEHQKFDPTNDTTFRRVLTNRTFESITTAATILAPTCSVIPPEDQNSTPKLLSYTINEGVKRGVYRCAFERSQGDNLQEVNTTRVAPVMVAPGGKSLLTDPYQISPSLSSDWRQDRRSDNRALYEANKDEGPRSNLTYLEEAYYFVPMHLALQLQQRCQYIAALDWFRVVYDYSVWAELRKIYFWLLQEQFLSESYKRVYNWLLDPLDPHGIAETRSLTYTRFTLIALVRCLLEFADSEFTRDTAESVPRARMLYMTALELLELPELNQKLGVCDALIGNLKIDVGSGDVVDPQGPLVLEQLKINLAKIGDAAKLADAVSQVNQVLASSDPLAVRFDKAKQIVRDAQASVTAVDNFGVFVQARDASLVQAHAHLLRESTVTDAVERIGQAAGEDFRQAVAGVSQISAEGLEHDKIEIPSFHDVAVSTDRTPGFGFVVGNGKWMGNGKGIGDLSADSKKLPSGDFIPTPSYSFCIPPNPLLRALRLHPELNLYKIRTCRNIAGMQRQLEPYAAPTDTTSGMPAIGAGGQLVLPGIGTLPPTPYRYTVLIERAKQLVTLAQQVESAFLSILEKHDAEAYGSLKARQDLRLTRAGVTLQDLRIKEAGDGVHLAELQQEKAQKQFDHYSQLLQDGSYSALEIAGLAFMTSAIIAEVAASIAFFVGIYSDVNKAGAAGQGISALASAAQTTAQLLLTIASFERRKQEWEFQRDLAQQDIKVGEQQVRSSQDHVHVATQERQIAVIQSEHSEATVEFLSTKFTNVELYDWMSGVLQRVYSFFLQQATTMARLASNQIAFERQEVPPPYIQSDYWDAPSDGGGQANTVDRRGLTGSARLLQDTYLLDKYAFDTNKRKLQLSKSISLARTAPAEFQRFRETGVMPFATPMEIFDRDFPGHYLRLIKRVKTSVIALIPPSQGIRATLSTIGTSRVVIGPDVFQTVLVTRPPEEIALSSPRDATGLSEPDTQPELLLPFESLGVDTHWELQMPRAANQFDYSTIADVLVTIDYTALKDFGYRQQVIQGLRPTISANRPFSFRQQFADQWYDLNNPEQTVAKMDVRFTTVREDFPSNLENLKIQQIILYFARAKGKAFEVESVTLRFAEQGGDGLVEGTAGTIDGMINTLNGNGSSWAAMQGRSPVGQWELVLPSTGEMKNRFKDNEIDDILFVITYSGLTPEWPI